MSRGNPFNPNRKCDEKKRSRHITIRLPMDCFEYVASTVKDGWTAGQEIASCVKAKMIRKGWGNKYL